MVNIVICKDYISIVKNKICFSNKFNIYFNSKCPKGSKDVHCHPGIDSPEQNALIHSAPEDIFVDGGVGPIG